MHLKWVLIIGIWLVAFGFIYDFTKNLAPESKFYVTLISIWPLLFLLVSAYIS